MNLPKISIVTPSFNQGNFLEESILSVISQNYPNLEYIIIDGGSEDSSVDIIKKYSSHINYWISKKDNGQSEAINKGFKRCTGDIVTWLNSDDCYLEGTFHKVAGHFAKGNFSLLYGKSILFGQGRRERIIGFSGKENVALRCLAYVPFPQPSTFFKRQVLLEQGYLDENLHYGLDHDLFVKMAMNYEIFGVDDVFSKYRYHEKGKSNFLTKFAEERIKVFSKVLRTFPGSNQLIQILKNIGYYSEGTDYYSVSKHFTLDDLKKAFIYFLEIQMHYYYLALDKKNSKAIAAFLLHYKDQLINRNDARKIYLRSLLLNRHLISFARKFTQN